MTYVTYPAEQAYPLKKTGRRPSMRTVVDRIFRGNQLSFALLIAIVITEWGAAVALGSRYLKLDPFYMISVDYLIIAAPAWFLIPLGWIGIITFFIVKRRIDRPSKTLLRLIRYRSDWLIRGIILFACYIPLARAFGIIKSSIPYINSYYLDPYLADLELAIFGSDPWLISHNLFPYWFTFAIDRIYVLWFTYMFLITGWFSFARDAQFQIKAAVAFNLTWFVLGGICAMALASVGPTFYDNFYGGEHFAALNNTLRQANDDRGLVAYLAMDYLLKSVGTGKLGAGISAMPSMHVSISYFGFLIAMASGARTWLKVGTAAFTIIILIGSVHLGWHYASDGIFSIVATTVIWWGSIKLVRALHREPVKKGQVDPVPTR